MKSVKTYLVIVSILLIIAISAGVYVWYLYQGLQETIDMGASPTNSEQSPTEGGEVVTPSSDTVTPNQTGVTIDARKLTETQRDILGALGYKGDTITISEAAVSCAQKAVGVTRFTEIINGAAPTPFELLSITPCLKK